MKRPFAYVLNFTRMGKAKGWRDLLATLRCAVETPRNSPLVEDRPLGAGALELVEARVGGDRYDAVEKFARLFALGRGGDDGAEEGDTVHRDHGSADVFPDLADPLVVGGAQGFVELVGVDV